MPRHAPSSARPMLPLAPSLEAHGQAPIRLRHHTLRPSRSHTREQPGIPESSTYFLTAESNAPPIFRHFDIDALLARSRQLWSQTGDESLTHAHPSPSSAEDTFYLRCARFQEYTWPYDRRSCKATSTSSLPVNDTPNSTSSARSLAKLIGIFAFGTSNSGHNRTC